MNGLDVAISAKWFGTTQVLGEIRFGVPRGQRVALLGPSGIGKSTLLSLIARTDPVFEGSITRPEGRIAMVFQTPRLLPWRTLAENICLVPGAGDLKRARSLLALVGLEQAADQYPEKVSLGMQRRAALVRAIAISPALILMDEPLVSLDPSSAADMRRVLTTSLDQTGAAALIATHDRREAIALADRILELEGYPARLVGDRRSPLGREDRLNAALVDALHAEWFRADV